MNRVEWLDQARDQLADIYVALPSDQREGLVRAVEEIEARLLLDPTTAGESRAPHVRVYFHAILVINFSAYPYNPVEITSVRLAKPRPKG